VGRRSSHNVGRRDPGRNGHFIINDPDRRGATADAYIGGL